MKLYMFLLCFSLFISCDNKNYKLNNFYKTFEHEFDGNNALIYEIKTIDNDSLYLIKSAFIPYYKRYQLNDSFDKNEWIKVEHDKFSDLDKDIRDEILLLSFKKYLNKEKVDLEVVKSEVLTSIEKRKIWDKKHEDEGMEELRNIINFNNKYCIIGDTIRINLGLSGSEKYYSIVYRSLQDKISGHYKMYDDSVDIIGIITSKYFGKNYSGYTNLKDDDLLNLFFDLKIIKIDKKNVYHFSNENLKKDNVIKLPLELYFRRIEKI